MRKGIVGCALSHIQLYINLLNDENTDAYCILEDDVDFVDGFGEKLLYYYEQFKLFSWDLVYLGHHLYKQYITDDSYNKVKMPSIEKWNRIISLTRSMGGTGGYIISKNGAKKLLEYIDKNGMTNGIDTIHQKSADELNIFYTTPHLIYSECYQGNNQTDTDIQRNLRFIKYFLRRKDKE